jgi:hypothetical protein
MWQCGGVENQYTQVGKVKTSRRKHLPKPSSKHSSLHLRELVNVDALVERYMAKRLPVLRQAVVRDEYEL